MHEIFLLSIQFQVEIRSLPKTLARKPRYLFTLAIKRSSIFLMSSRDKNIAE